ncbi:MAG TPA: hypothetical protein VFT93_06975 [Candidatus Eisenbacteria bacterium]|nr:hypothetical protein [Candidatus Eisenbacteria bacterium]
MSLSTRGLVPLSTLPASWRRLLAGGAALLLMAVTPPSVARAQETTQECIDHSKEAAAEAKKALAASKKKGASKATTAPAPVATPAAAKVAAPKPKSAAAPRGPIKRTLTTLRGELVDYYCYIEKGARGPEHKDCAMRCVAGDICMGLLTPDDQLMMLSVQHLRVMEPLAWRGIPDPFQTCRGLLNETVDLTGYVMQRKGQKIIEVTAVKVVKVPPNPKSAAYKFTIPTPPKPGPNVVQHHEKRVPTTLRGELVDYYCYIEKGARGPEHRDCAVRCVAGDVCMGLLTTDEKTLMMLSVNHLRAMDPRAWRGVPDPFTTCRGLLAETVDLTGYVIERHGQKIIEVTDVKVVPKS